MPSGQSPANQDKAAHSITTAPPRRGTWRITKLQVSVQLVARERLLTTRRSRLHQILTIPTLFQPFDPGWLLRSSISPRSHRNRRTTADPGLGIDVGLGIDIRIDIRIHYPETRPWVVSSSAGPRRNHDFLYATTPLPGALRGQSGRTRQGRLLALCIVKQFIRNVRAAKTIADERTVIYKESAAIRASFKDERGDRDHNIR